MSGPVPHAAEDGHSAADAGEAPEAQARAEHEEVEDSHAAAEARGAEGAERAAQAPEAPQAQGRAEMQEIENLIPRLELTQRHEIRMRNCNNC